MARTYPVNSFQWRIKVAEHSFRARSLLMQFSARTRITKKKHAINRAIMLFTLALSMLFFSIIERSVLLVLVFCYKDVLEKVTMQRIQQFILSFSLLPKEPS